MDRSWLVQKSKNVENFGNFGHISKNKTRNEILVFLALKDPKTLCLTKKDFFKIFPEIELLVFFDPVGPQDATFDKNRFFQPFSSFSKVRGKKRTGKLLMTGQ